MDDNSQSSDLQDQPMNEKGQKGGQATGQGHQLNDHDKSKGGQNSSGNFANDPDRAHEAGIKGGSSS